MFLSCQRFVSFNSPQRKESGRPALATFRYGVVYRMSEKNNMVTWRLGIYEHTNRKTLLKQHELQTENSDADMPNSEEQTAFCPLWPQFTLFFCTQRRPESTLCRDRMTSGSDEYLCSHRSSERQLGLRL